MRFELVIFDKDGTLIDIHYYWGGMVRMRADILSNRYVDADIQKQVANELMSNMGIDLDSMKIKMTGPVGIKPREHIADVAYQTIKTYCNEITLDQVLSVFKEVDVYSQSNLQNLVKPLPGVESLLIGLRERGIKTAIATTDLTSRAKMAMDSIGLTHYFDKIVGSDLVEKAKPSPDMVNYLCDKMLIDKSKIVVIADALVDMQMSELAEVDFIGVDTGLSSPEFLNSDHTIVNNLLDVKKVLL